MDASRSPPDGRRFPLRVPSAQQGHRCVPDLPQRFWACPSFPHSELEAQRSEGFALLKRAGCEGFGSPERNQLTLRRADLDPHEGRPVALFEPLDPARRGDCETLWRPRQGSGAAYLNDLFRLTGIPWVQASRDWIRVTLLLLWIPVRTSMETRN